MRTSLRGPAPRRDSTNRRPRPRAAPRGRSRASPSQRRVPPPARRSSLAAPPCRWRGGAEAAVRGQTPAPVSRGAGRARAATSPRPALPEDGSRSPCLCGAAAAPWPVISGNFYPRDGSELALQRVLLGRRPLGRRCSELQGPRSFLVPSSCSWTARITGRREWLGRW